MKQLSNSCKNIAILFIGFFTPAVTWAQDSLAAIVDDIVVETTVIDDGPFYAQLWFWVLLGIVFLLVLLALIWGGGKKRKEPKQVQDEKVEKNMEEKNEE